MFITTFLAIAYTVLLIEAFTVERSIGVWLLPLTFCYGVTYTVLTFDWSIFWAGFYSLVVFASTFGALAFFAIRR